MTVLQIQTLLGVTVDGVLGPITLAAIKAFQSAHSLVPDGIVGKLTEAALLGSPAVVSAPPTYLKALDVSEYQGEIDLAQVKAAGYEFISIKASEGGHIIDPNFVKNWQGAKAAGLLRSAYHFQRGSVGILNFDNFIRAMNLVGNDFGELPPALDWEVKEVDSSSEQDNAIYWLRNVEIVSGRKPLLYSYASFFETIGSPSWLADYPLWLAAYTGHSTPPACPSPWESYKFWQSWSDNVNHIPTPVPGITPGTECDFDLFLGTMEELKTWVK